MMPLIGPVLSMSPRSMPTDAVAAPKTPAASAAPV